MPIYGLESTTKMGVLKEILHTIGETEENTEYVCIGSWEERIVLYVLYLVPCMYSKEKKSATIFYTFI